MKALMRRLSAMSLLTGAIIGAGMFSLPYVISQTGAAAGLIYGAAAVGVMTLVHLLYADLILRAPGHGNFVGCARRYLGPLAAEAAIVTSVVGMVFVLVVYVVLSASFVRLIGVGDEFAAAAAFVFWFCGSVIMLRPLKQMAAVQLAATIGMAAIIFMIAFFGWRAGDLRLPVFGFLRFTDLLAPVGPLFFALSGRVAVAEAVRYFSPRRPLTEIRRVIVGGTLLPAALYAVFVVGVVALSQTVTEDAVTGLAGRLPAPMLALTGILGLLAIGTSYAAVGFDVKNILESDLGWSWRAAGAVTVGAPLLFYQLGLRNFVVLVSAVGGLFVSLEAIFIVLMWLGSGRSSPTRPRLIKNLGRGGGAALIILFVIIMLNQVWQLAGGW